MSTGNIMREMTLAERVTALETQFKALTAGKAAGDGDAESSEDWGRVVKSIEKITASMDYKLLFFFQGQTEPNLYHFFTRWSVIATGYPAIVAKLVEMGVW